MDEWIGGLVGVVHSWIRSFRDLLKGIDRTHSRLASSIKLPAMVKDKVIERRRQGAQPVEFFAGLDENVFRKA